MQPMMRARTVVHDEQVVADVDEVAGALPLERRRRRAGSEQRDLHAWRNITLRSPIKDIRSVDEPNHQIAASCELSQLAETMKSSQVTIGAVTTMTAPQTNSPR